MPVIAWDETSPPDGESAGLGDDRIRSLKSSIRVGLAGEHVWPAGGGDAGTHLLGSARPYVGPQSLVSSTGTDGRLFHASDTSRLFGVGSGGTTFLGGPTVISAGSFPGSVPQRAHWVEEFGEASTATVNSAQQVAFPNSGYSGAPFVFISAYSSPNFTGTIGVAIKSITATTFDWQAASRTSILWRSIGTRAL